jgi:hypothetical protein
MPPARATSLAYRLARRNAHNADAALSTTLANMLMEPGHFRKDADMGFRFLVMSHTLLSYLSGLGAHRDTVLPADVREQLIEGAGSKTLADEHRPDRQWVGHQAGGCGAKMTRKRPWPASLNKCRMKSMKPEAGANPTGIDLSPARAAAHPGRAFDQGNQCGLEPYREQARSHILICEYGHARDGDLKNTTSRVA